jgi:hypothetical protein
MTINSINYGVRQPPGDSTPNTWASLGVSMAANPVQLLFGHTQQDVPIKFLAMSESNMQTLRQYLEQTVGKYGVVAVTPDSGDDLGLPYGTTFPVNLIYVSFKATASYTTLLWDVDLVFRYYL